MKKYVLNLSFYNKICLDYTNLFIDFSNVNSIWGWKKLKTIVLKPDIISSCFRKILFLINSISSKNLKIVFLVNIENQLIFHKFQEVCRERNLLILNVSEVTERFISQKCFQKRIFISLFIDFGNFEAIRKEILSKNIPLISFQDLSLNKSQNTLTILGNFKTFLIQNLIITLITISLQRCLTDQLHIKNIRQKKYIKNFKSFRYQNVEKN